MKRFFSIIALAVIALSVACQPPPPAKHYPVQAEVIAVDAPKKLITVKHGDIPGLMPAMTMQYVVAEPKQIATLQPGDKITADLVVSEGRGQLEQIVLVSKADAKP
jgi:protein SCO1/2